MTYKKDYFETKLLEEGFTFSEISTIINIISRTCQRCWNGDEHCQCWNDE